jgi:hypothetical protein
MGAGDNMPFFSPSSTNPKLAYLPLTDRLVVRASACTGPLDLLRVYTAVRFSLTRAFLMEHAGVQVFLPSHNVLLLVDTNRRETVPINIPVPGSQQFSLFGT